MDLALLRALEAAQDHKRYRPTAYQKLEAQRRLDESFRRLDEVLQEEVVRMRVRLAARAEGLVLRG